MFNIADYRLLEKIYESAVSEIYRGVRCDGEQPVVLKMLRKEYPPQGEILQYRQEYRITRSLGDLSGVIRVHELESHQNGLVLILEDISAQSLRQLIHSTPLNLEESIIIAIKICESLGQVHSKDVIHKKPLP